MIEALLKEIAERYPENLTDDDVTVLVVRVNGRPPHHSFSEKLKALIRFFRSLIARDQSEGGTSAVAGRESREYRRRDHPRARAALAREEILAES